MKQRFIQTLVAGLMVSGSIAANAYDSCCYNPCDDCCCDWYVYGDYLYWNACRSGLDYAVSLDQETPYKVLGPAHVKKFDDKWDSGFRVGLGYRCDESTDLGVRYTYFQASNKLTDSFTNGAGATRLHAAIAAGAPYDVGSADGDYTLKYNVLDLELGAWSSQGCDLKIRPYVGVRLAWIKQDVTVDYTSNITTPTDQEYLKQYVNTDAYGVMMGVDARYHLCDCFYLVARVSSGGLYGDNDYRTQVTDIFVPETPVEEVYVVGCDCRAIFSSEVSLGLEFFLCDMCGSDLMFSFGYELHTWMGLTDFLDFPSAELQSKIMRDDASLMLHGLFVRLGASF